MHKQLSFGQNLFLRNLAKGETIKVDIQDVPDHVLLMKKIDILIASDRRQVEEIRSLKEVKKQYEEKIILLANDLNKRSVELDMCLNILGQIKTAASTGKNLQKVLNKFSLDCINMNSLPNIH